MKIQFFCPRWGSEHLSIGDFCRKAKAAGYDGVELSLPTGNHAETAAILKAIAEAELYFIGQHWQTSDVDFSKHAETFTAHLRWLAAAKPLFINTQTGRDWFDFETNRRIIAVAGDVAAESGVDILHETHRGKFSFCAAATRRFLEADPELRISADFSHWCAVSESLLEDQKDSLALAISRADHIHARVGFAEAAQVSDPRAPEWKGALDAHLTWWDAIIQAQRGRGTEVFTVTVEFGPFPYLPALPWTRMPVADQWELNLFMKDLLGKRWS